MEVEEPIDKYIARVIQEDLEDLRRRFRCPRCNVLAYPSKAFERYHSEGVFTPIGEWRHLPGWCPICGMDPLEEGPQKPMTFPNLKGISVLLNDKNSHI